MNFDLREIFKDDDINFEFDFGNIEDRKYVLMMLDSMEEIEDDIVYYRDSFRRECKKIHGSKPVILASDTLYEIPNGKFDIINFFNSKKIMTKWCTKDLKNLDYVQKLNKSFRDMLLFVSFCKDKLIKIASEIREKTLKEKPLFKDFLKEKATFEYELISGPGNLECSKWTWDYIVPKKHEIGSFSEHRGVFDISYGQEKLIDETYDNILVMYYCVSIQGHTSYVRFYKKDLEQLKTDLSEFIKKYECEEKFTFEIANLNLKSKDLIEYSMKEIKKRQNSLLEKNLK